MSIESAEIYDKNHERNHEIAPPIHRRHCDCCGLEIRNPKDGVHPKDNGYWFHADCYLAWRALEMDLCR
jgi:hypothetical protein